MSYSRKKCLHANLGVQLSISNMMNLAKHLSNMAISCYVFIALTCVGHAVDAIPEKLRELIDSEQPSYIVDGSDAQSLIDNLEEIIIGNRLAIQRWQTTVSASALTGADGETDQIMRVDTFVDGDKLRRDFYYRTPLSNRSDDSRYVSIRSVNGLREYEYSQTPDPLGLNFSLVFREVTQLRQPPTIERTVQYDPRSIGNFSNGAISPAWGPGGTLKRVDFTSVDISRDKLSDGTLCLKVRKKDSNDNILTYWASPSEGLSIRRYVYDANDTIDPTHFEQTDTEVKRWKDSQIWVPVATKYTQKYDSVLQVDEVAQITWHSINQPIDPDLFEPVTFPGLEPGTQVFDVHEMLGPKRRMIWNGQRIVDEDIRPATADEIAEVSKGNNIGLSRSQILLFINAAVFVIIAALFLWRSTRNSPK